MTPPTALATAERIVSYLGDRGRRGDLAADLDIQVNGAQLLLDPDEADLPTEMQRITLRYWQGLPKVGGIPDQLKVDPEALHRALGYLMLVDRLEGACEFRYALYGSKIAAVSGFDMTGQNVSDIATLDEIRVFFAACYQAVIQLRQPLFTVHEAPSSITVSHWHRLILPLGQQGAVRRFLICNVPIHDGVIV